MKKPAFSEKLHVGRPNIGNRKELIRRINDMLDRKWLTNEGKFVQEFEQRIAEYLDVKHCIAICNGTIALEIAIRALGLKGEVIVPSWTFVATAHALQWQEITPVFCDVDLTHNIDPSKIERMITPRTTGILGVHLWGRPCDIDAVQEIADRRNLKLLFDASHAFGCMYSGVDKVGRYGNAEVFSFHATKFFNTFEGGAVVTNDDELAHKIRLMKNFGFWGGDVIYIGTNGKMSEASAAMGLTNLEIIYELFGINYRNFKAYREGLDIPGIQLITRDWSNNWQYIVIEVDESITGISRDDLMEALRAENVLARRYFYPGCHRMEPYRSYFPHAGLLLPVTEYLAERTLCLPTGNAIDESHIKIICEIIRGAM